jgi:hypothetical protein
MKRTLITISAAVLAAVPATVGLSGNASFAQTVPVRTPSQVTVAQDKGRPAEHAEPGDDKGGRHLAIQAARSADDKGGRGKHAEPGDDKGGRGKHAEPGDDKGGRHLATQAARSVDDKGGRGKHAEPGDDKGGHGGDDGPGHS